MIGILSSASAQPRVEFNDRQLFLSGSNIAWINFANDVGPGQTNFNAFRIMFDTVQAYHGNVMRWWLHTTGSTSPAFNSNKMVTGPGTGTISDIKAVLDLAWQRKIGLMLCLWSFDMLRTSNGTGITDRAKLLLTDTVYLKAYLDSALAPIVTALKGYPGIITWEVFNEPEGMSEEYGWDFNLHVPMSDIQRFVNRVAGTIHRIDSSAKVTNGSWSFIAQTDVPTANENIAPNTADMRAEFKLHYGADISPDRVLAKIHASQNTNCYRDDRLIAAGGDPEGTLDFYTVHYYNWAGTSLSPFHHPYSYWQLDKPLVVAEFYLNDTFGVSYKDIYRELHSNGYAGGLSWSWTDNAVNAVQQLRTKEVMKDLFYHYPWDIDPSPVTGKIYSFRGSSTTVVKGDTVILEWKTPVGTSVFLDGNSVASSGNVNVIQENSSTYTLRTTGAISETSQVTITVYPTGKILSFTAIPSIIAVNETSNVEWSTAKSPAVTLNGNIVSENGSMIVSPAATATYTLISIGDIFDTASVTITIVPVDQVNRALLKPLTVTSTNPTDQSSYSGNLVDGKLATYWKSDVFESQSIVIDLMQQYQVKKLVLRWAANYAKAYRIGLSPDSLQWSLVKSQANGLGGVEIVDSVNVVSRYLKILLDKSASQGVYSLYEIETYGTPVQTDVIARFESSPSHFALFQNYPNPFNPSTEIRFGIPNAGQVDLIVFNTLGQRVAGLLSQQLAAGTYSVKFDASHLSSGVYFYTMRAGSYFETRKMVLVR
jgi:hypothetical protein